MPTTTNWSDENGYWHKTITFSKEVEEAFIHLISDAFLVSKDLKKLHPFFYHFKDKDNSKKELILKGEFKDIQKNQIDLCVAEVFKFLGLLLETTPELPNEPATISSNSSKKRNTDTLVGFFHNQEKGAFIEQKGQTNKKIRTLSHSSQAGTPVTLRRLCSIQETMPMATTANERSTHPAFFSGSTNINYNETTPEVLFGSDGELMLELTHRIITANPVRDVVNEVYQIRVKNIPNNPINYPYHFKFLIDRAADLLGLQDKLTYCRYQKELILIDFNDLDSMNQIFGKLNELIKEAHSYVLKKNAGKDVTLAVSPFAGFFKSKIKNLDKYRPTYEALRELQMNPGAIDILDLIVKAKSYYDSRNECHSKTVTLPTESINYSRYFKYVIEQSINDLCIGGVSVRYYPPSVTLDYVDEDKLQMVLNYLKEKLLVRNISTRYSSAILPTHAVLNPQMI